MPDESESSSNLVRVLEQAQTPEGFSKELRHAIGTLIKEDESNSPPAAEIAEKLKTIYKSFAAKDLFSVGQLVKWKPNLKNRRRPRYDEPALVVTILDKPFVDNKDDAGTPYFNEPLDLELGVIDRNGNFLCYHYDSRRFEAF